MSARGSSGSWINRSWQMTHAFFSCSSGPSASCSISWYLSTDDDLCLPAQVARGAFQVRVIGIDLSQHAFAVVGVGDLNPLGAQLQFNNWGDGAVVPPALDDVLAIQPLIRHGLGAIQGRLYISGALEGVGLLVIVPRKVRADAAQWIDLEEVRHTTSKKGRCQSRPSRIKRSQQPSQMP